MKLLASITIRGGEGKKIKLYQGDLTSLRPSDHFDLLVVSAFPDEYIPTRNSLIGALHRKGLSIADLAERKELDLRSNFSCWLSEEVKPPHAGLRFKRILCFEPLVRGAPPAIVGDIFRALIPIIAEKKEIRTVAMPIVAAGNQLFSITEMLDPLVKAAIHWMENGLPLIELRIVAHSDRQANEAKKVFYDKAKVYAASVPPPSITKADFDVFISYAHENSAYIEIFEAALVSANRNLRIFLDRKNIDVGAPWQPEIFESLDRCRKVVAIFSPAYLSSKVCKEEFNIAWMRSREIDQEIIFPIYLYTAQLPTYMKYRNYVDCREGDKEKLKAASNSLLYSLASRA